MTNSFISHYKIISHVSFFDNTKKTLPGFFSALCFWVNDGYAKLRRGHFDAPHLMTFHIESKCCLSFMCTFY